eukprot:132005_1
MADHIAHVAGIIGVFTNLLGLCIGFILIILAISLIYTQYKQETYTNRLTSIYAIFGLTFFTLGTVCAALESYYFMYFDDTYTIFGDRIDKWALCDVFYFLCADIGQFAIYVFLINRLNYALHGMSKRYYILFNILSVINLLLGLYVCMLIFQYQSYNHFPLSNKDRLMLSDIPIIFGLIISLFLTFIIIYLFVTKTLQIVVEHKLHHTFDSNDNDAQFDGGCASPAFSDDRGLYDREISIMTMSSDLFNMERSQESVLNSMASIIVVSSVLLLINVLYLIYVVIWYGLYEFGGSHARFRHMREFGVCVSGILAIIDNLCIYIAMDCSSKWYHFFCHCFHGCWLKVAQNYTEKHVQNLRQQKQPFLSARSIQTPMQHTVNT